MTIRSRLNQARTAAGRAILGGEMGRIQESFETMARAYRRGPFALPPEVLIQQLGEIDSQLIDLIARQRGVDILHGQAFGTQLQFTEADRLLIIQQTRFAAHYDAQAGGAVRNWTDFGFGKRVIIKPKDERLDEIFGEFWNAPRNRSLLKQSNLDDLSDTLVKDGEVFFVFYIAQAGGQTTIRRLKTEDITKIIYEIGADNKPDTDVPLFYVQGKVKEIYWPDWAATKDQLAKVKIPQGAQRADEIVEGTTVKVQRVSYVDINGRGWPAIYRAIPWYDGYKEALWDWAAVASSVAMHPHKIKHKGGSRATDAIKNLLVSSLDSTGYGPDTNPPPPPGTPWIESDAVERLSTSLKTGAMEWGVGTMLLLGQASIADGVPLAYRGRPDSNQNRSTAEITTIPWDNQMDRYAAVWADTFREWVEIVGMAAQKFGATRDTKFETLAADVSVSRPATLTTSTDDLVNGINALEKAILSGATSDVEKAQAALNALIALLLERFGASVEVEDEAAPGVDEPEPGSAEDVAMMALGNYQRGAITGEQLVEHLFATAVIRE